MAARVTCLIPKFAHITLVLRELHWLPVKFRVEFKIALLVFKTLNGLAPQYLFEPLLVKRSDSETLLVIRKVTRKTFGDRAFFHAGLFHNPEINMSAVFKILAFQNPDFKILVDFKMLAFHVNQL